MQSPTDSDSDHDLIARLRCDDTVACAELFRRYFAALARTAYSVVGAQDMAEDVAQDVFFHLWEIRHSVTITGRVAAYLHTAAYRRGQEVMRSERAASTRAVTAEERREGDDLPTHMRPPDASVLIAERTGALQKAIEELDGRTGAIFRLWWWEGLSYEEIAQVTGISVKGVKQARFRALGQLRKILTPLM